MLPKLCASCLPALVFIGLLFPLSGITGNCGWGYYRETSLWPTTSVACQSDGEPPEGNVGKCCLSWYPIIAFCIVIFHTQSKFVHLLYCNVIIQLMCLTSGQVEEGGFCTMAWCTHTEEQSGPRLQCGNAQSCERLRHQGSVQRLTEGE